MRKRYVRLADVIRALTPEARGCWRRFETYISWRLICWTIESKGALPKTASEVQGVLERAGYDVTQGMPDRVFPMFAFWGGESRLGVSRNEWLAYAAWFEAKRRAGSKLLRDIVHEPDRYAALGKAELRCRLMAAGIDLGDFEEELLNMVASGSHRGQLGEEWRAVIDKTGPSVRAYMDAKLAKIGINARDPMLDTLQEMFEMGCGF